MFFFIFELTREQVMALTPYSFHSMCHSIVHIVTKFQFFIHIFTVAKLKNKIPTF